MRSPTGVKVVGIMPQTPAVNTHVLRAIHEHRQKALSFNLFFNILKTAVSFCDACLYESCKQCYRTILTETVLF